MIYFIMWYILGLIGCGLLIREDYNDGRSVNLFDIIAGLVYGLGGLVILFWGLFEAGYFESLKNKIENTIIIKNPKEDE